MSVCNLSLEVSTVAKDDNTVISAAKTHRKLPERRIKLIKKRKISPTAIAGLSETIEWSDSNKQGTAGGGEISIGSAAKRARVETDPSHAPLRNLIPDDWRNALNDANLLDTPNMHAIEKQYHDEIEINQRLVHPRRDEIFKALELCPLSKVRVVIIGQDPYPRVGQAMGLAFSVHRGISIPPSLQNIFKELSNDYNGDFAMPVHGDLSDWARQGVLLLNTSLTVRDKEPASHAQWGWHEFTDNLIRLVCRRHKNIVFIMWGLHAQNRGAIVPTTKSEGGHYKLRARHPSPKSAQDGFFGCGHFTECNELLARHNITPIEWGTRLDGSPLPRPQQTQMSITNFVRISKSPIKTDN